MNEIMTKQKSDLTVETIKKYICPDASEQEAFMFLKLCQHRGLNPFIKEAYLVKYGDAPATMIVGKDAFMKRAEQQETFDGFEAGILLDSGDDYTIHEQRSGTFMRKEERLVGGWAKVYRKDRTHATEVSVSMSEYDTGKATWKKMPATMIRKVALVQALRETYPLELSGMYISDELSVEEPTGPRDVTAEYIKNEPEEKSSELNLNYRITPLSPDTLKNYENTPFRAKCVRVGDKHQEWSIVNISDSKGNNHSIHEVRITNDGLKGDCDCPGFAHTGGCIHLIKIQEMVQKKESKNVEYVK